MATRVLTSSDDIKVFSGTQFVFINVECYGIATSTKVILTSDEKAKFYAGNRQIGDLLKERKDLFSQLNGLVNARDALKEEKSRCKGGTPKMLQEAFDRNAAEKAEVKSKLTKNQERLDGTFEVLRMMKLDLINRALKQVEFRFDKQVERDESKTVAKGIAVVRSPGKTSRTDKEARDQKRAQKRAESVEIRSKMKSVQGAKPDRGKSKK